MAKYGGENVHFRAHGVLSARPEPPDLSRRGFPEHRILVFGKWGTYKRLRIVITGLRAGKEVYAQRPPGGSRRRSSDGARIRRSVAARYRNDRSIEFTGYVEEHDLPPLFRTASVLVMPYSSATGASGVAHLGCEYGLPMVSADIPDFREMAEDERLAMDFYKTGDAGSLADALLQLLSDPERQKEMAEQNFSAALRMTMPEIVRQVSVLVSARPTG